MARFAGKGGSITNGGSNVAIKSFEVDAKGDAIDVTGMDSSGAKAFIAGLTEWSGSITGLATGDVTSWKPGTTMTAMVLDTAGGLSPTLTGDAIITGLKVSTAVDGAVTVDITFQGTGALAYG